LEYRSIKAPVVGTNYKRIHRALWVCAARNRGIFAINELPDLAARFKSDSSTSCRKGDVQIKGYPIRLPLDVAIVLQCEP